MSRPRDFGEEIVRLRDKMNQLLNEASGEMERPEILDEVEWVPPLDVLENKDEIIVKADVPGVAVNEIDLSITGNVIQIRGERKKEMEREDENYHTIERGYGKFGRNVKLPVPVSVDSITASYKDGVLTVKLPKMEEEKVGRIRVKLSEEL